MLEKNSQQISEEEAPYDANFLIKMDEQIEETSQSFYLEGLKPVLFEFFERFDRFAVISYDNELRGELRTLFDAEMIDRMADEAQYDEEKAKTSKTKDLLYEKMNLDNNIKLFESILNEKNEKGLNSVFIEQMLKKLNAEKKILERKLDEISSQVENALKPYYRADSCVETINERTPVKIEKPRITNDEQKMNALKEIFTFYARQHVQNSKNKTFDLMKSELESIDLGEFIKFAKDFEICLKKENYVEIFKRTAENRHEMTFFEFKVIF